MIYVPFDKRDDVDQEHVMRIGNVKVFFFNHFVGLFDLEYINH